MTDPRDTARTWLADAILSAPGVEVAEEYLPPTGPLAWAVVDAPRATRPIIRLPAQPIQEAP